MINVKANFKGTNRDTRCGVCKIDDETTEHIFCCQKTKEHLNRHEAPETLEIETDDICRLLEMQSYALAAIELRKMYLLTE
jgi:hypothetical protein